MIETTKCLKCGAGPAGPGGICVACAMKENIRKLLNETKERMSLTIKSSQGDDNKNPYKTIDPKDNYSINPIAKDAGTQKRARQYSSPTSIDGVVRSDMNNESNTGKNKATINYMMNPNIKGYISNMQKQADVRYIMNPVGYSISSTNNIFSKDVSSSYGPKPKAGYFGVSTTTYYGSSAPKYGGSCSAGSSYSGKSSGSAQGSASYSSGKK